MDPRLVVEAARGRAADRLMLVSHSGQLYVPESLYWNGTLFAQPHLARHFRQAGRDRLPTFLRETDPFRADGVLVGLEVDADFEGHPILLEEDHPRFDCLIGSVHFLPGEELWSADPDAAAEEFLRIHDRFLASGIHILGHPLRKFSGTAFRPAPDMIDALVDLLARHGVAAELSYHYQEPMRPFFLRCIERGVPIALGSDAHQLREVADLTPHLELLEDLGSPPQQLFAP
jgi:histidinol phosphatase-like PHP family hydrolase